MGQPFASMSVTPVCSAPVLSASLCCRPLGTTAWLVAPRGEVFLRETRAIERAVLRAAIDGWRVVVLDLTGVATPGGGLLGGILRMRRGLGAIGGRLLLVVDGPPVDALVRVSVIEALVEVVPTVDAAVTLLAGTDQRFRHPI